MHGNDDALDKQENGTTLPCAEHCALHYSARQNPPLAVQSTGTAWHRPVCIIVYRSQKLGVIAMQAIRNTYLGRTRRAIADQNASTHYLSRRPVRRTAPKLVLVVHGEATQMQRRRGEASRQARQVGSQPTTAQAALSTHSTRTTEMKALPRSGYGVAK